MKKIIYAILVSFLLIIFLPTVTLAQKKFWYFPAWEVDIRINKDSTFIVREKQTFDFTGNFHWVKRDIAKQRLKKITDVKVFDETGRELLPPTIEISEDSKQVSVKINFDLTDTQATWTFQYTVHGGIGYFENYDELYWNAVSSEREVEIRSVKVTVHLPEDVERSKLKQKLFIGSYGSTSESHNFFIANEKTLEYRGQNIAPFENFTIVAGWPKGVVSQPGMVKVYSEPKGSNIIIDDKKTDYQTPFILEEKEEIETGRHKIEVAKFGYKKVKTKTVEVAQGKLEEINFTLEKTFFYKIFPFLIYFLIPILTFLVLFRRWYKFGRDPKWKGTIIAQYEPPLTETRQVLGKPSFISPAEMEVLVYEKVKNKSIAATLIDLAVRGYLKIIEEEKTILFSKQKEYIFLKLKDYSNDATLREHERLILDGIFGLGEKVFLNDLKNKFYKKIPEINNILYKQVVELGYFEKSPAKTKAKYARVGMLFIFFSICLFFFKDFWASLDINLMGLVGALVFSGVICFVFAKVMPAKTKLGSDAAWHAFGFKEYLHTAERFRLGTCTPETFEKFLSYAMIFGVEKKWAERFDDIYKEPPRWYETTTPMPVFSVVSFTNNLSSMTQMTVSTLTTSPSSSSGFGGGGFAGGGGGGGGSSAG